MTKQRKPKKTKAQKVADRFRKREDKRAAPLLAQAAGGPDIIGAPVNQVNHSSVFAGDDECIYCGEKNCGRVDRHGPEWDEAEERRALDEQAFKEQERIDLMHYTAAREVVHDFWAQDSAQVLGRINGLSQRCDWQRDNINELFRRVKRLRNDALAVALLLVLVGVSIWIFTLPAPADTTVSFPPGTDCLTYENGTWTEGTCDSDAPIVNGAPQ